MRRATRLVAAILICGAAAACAGHAPPPSVAAPKYPDFVFPAVPAALSADTAAGSRLQRGWQFLQAGDLRNAERELSAAVRKNSRFYPADAALGYVRLAARDYTGAMTRFDLALEQGPNYPPALVGRGDALLGLSRTTEALQAFQAALAADPSVTIAAQRVQVLQLRVLQADLTDARRAADAGRLDEARNAYQRAIAASPDSAFLYRDLGAIERRRGDTTAALEAFRQAISKDPTDARSFLQAGELLEALGDFDGAVQAYSRAVAIEPGNPAAAALERARRRAALAKLPAEFAEIAGAPRVTRGDLAALIGVRFPKLLDSQQGRPTPVITDTRGHWAAAWILSVTRAGLMEVNPNHTFQPQAVIHRLDLARVVSRVLDLAAALQPSIAAPWQPGAPGQPAIVDVPAAHLNYAAVAQVVAARVMPLFDDGTFRPTQNVTGQEAVQVMDRVEAVLGREAGGPFGERLP